MHVMYFNQSSLYFLPFSSSSNRPPPFPYQLHVLCPFVNALIAHNASCMCMGVGQYPGVWVAPRRLNHCRKLTLPSSHLANSSSARLGLHERLPPPCWHFGCLDLVNTAIANMGSCVQRPCHVKQMPL